MSIKQNYTNFNGTTSKVFQIGKNRVILSGEEQGSLIFSVYEADGTLTQWKMNSTSNEIEFPTGDKVKIDPETKEILLGLGDTSLGMSLVTEGPQTGAIQVKTTRNTEDGVEDLQFKIGVNDTRSHMPEYEVDRTDIPNVWAVWNSIKRVKDLMVAEILVVSDRVTAIETKALELEDNLTELTENVANYDPGTWD